MGTFVASRQVRQNINLMPAWWLSGASIDLDFDNQRYYDASLGASASLAPLNSYLSISRASTGYAKTAAGTLTSFGNDTLRITDLGLLVEDARTNIVTRSQELDHADWTKTHVSVTANATTAPDGSATADLVIPDVTLNFHTIAVGTTISVLATASSITIYAKPSGYTWISLSRNGTSAVASFNLGAGVVGSVSGTATSAIEALANGWYRCTMFFSATSGIPDNIYVGLNTADVSGGSSNNNNTGDGTSGVYLWGAQYEQNAFPSSYIPTVAASATRAADLVSFAGSAKTLLEANSDQSIVADVVNNNPSLISNNNQNIICDNTTANDSKILFGTSGAQKNVGWILHGVANQNVQLGSGDLYSPFKAGFSQNAGSGISIVGNAGTVGTNANRMALTNPRLGAKTDSDSFFGYIRRLTLWNTKLADATLQSLTTPSP